MIEEDIEVFRGEVSCLGFIGVGGRGFNEWRIIYVYFLLGRFEGGCLFKSFRVIKCFRVRWEV